VVWAPRARVIEVLVPYDPQDEPEHMPLRLVGAGEPGYWGADSVLGHGTDYGYSVDGGPLLPDPRSVWLPQGIHGPTRVFDPAFEWTDGSWSPPDLSTSVLMHVDVETFTPEGTLDAAAALLPTVAELGAHGVELAPVAAFDPAVGPTRGVRLYSVHEAYGGPRALQRFINAAHAVGLAVVLDIP
jgi:1,4-alpha-glucan branching enzyme